MTQENNKIAKALGAIKETQWVGEVTHDTIDKCLTAISFYHTSNSGHYIPKAIRIKKISGVFMLNENGRIHFESRIIKVADNKFKIEHLSNEAYNIFEREYSNLI